jgi:predicted translin family RNA/ssDNA-binding protein
MKNLKELEELQKVAVEITRLCAEYSRRAQTESHKDLEPLWNQIQDLKKQLKEGAQ